MRKWLLLAAVLLTTACDEMSALMYREGRADATRAYDLPTLSPAERGAIYFAAGDLKTLSTETLNSGAAPWALAKASLTLDHVGGDLGRVDQASFRETMRGFGFIFPDTIDNWPAGVAAPKLDGPLGMAIGPIEGMGMRVTAANLACGACHAGVSYNADGSPRPDRAWLGGANTSLNLETYSAALLRSFVAYGEKPDLLLKAAAKLSPNMSAAEERTLRRFVLPPLLKRAKKLHRETGRVFPFDNGHAGTTNGIGAMKLRFGLLTEKQPNMTQIGLVSIPVINAAFWRSSLLSDNAYAYRGAPRYRAIDEDDINDAHLDGLAAITSLFLVSTAGVSYDRAPQALPQVKDIYRFLNSTRAAPFPGKIDAPLAARGASIYAQTCASCHGEYKADPAGPILIRFPNWHGEKNTDLMRAKSFDAAMATRIMRSNYAALIEAQSSDNYSAPPLAGLWSSAPYLHNGSVPSVWAMLTPQARPKKFNAGGHALDFRTLGISLDSPDASGIARYPRGYKPWSGVSTIDTTAPGYSNKGHDYGARLNTADKTALIEFLKQL